ncbi:polycomb protein eed [Galendromus occidentalis]|uniref:Polycomb protein esc n=1 Tax=Galendromus occidentalis TaxID=34638 RepID=A0AAJ6QX17_9ACAR|nr:polycomb protein eed [Galendromus occidentalis]
MSEKMRAKPSMTSSATSSSISDHDETSHDNVSSRLGLDDSSLGSFSDVGAKRFRGFLPPFKYTSHGKEDHEKALFAVQFNPHVEDRDIFATCGTNKVSVYEAIPGSMKLLQSYADPEPDETYYTCAWTYDETGEPLLAVAGFRGIIRVINTHRMDTVQHYVGHGNAINEIKVHPRDHHLLLSVSKDHTLRLWNLKTEQCVVIFGGVEGHRDEVLSADFDLTGERIVSCGMDHSLKIWRLDHSVIQKGIHDSYLYQPQKHTRAFPTVNQNFPDFTTRDIHQNYVDCVRWLGNLILSKSTEHVIVCWKPGYIEQRAIKTTDSTVTILHQFHYKDSRFWFLRFGLDREQRQLSVGNETGKTYVWEIDVEDPATSKCSTLSHPKCTTIVRQTSFNNRGDMIICVCDDATLWRWDRMPVKSDDTK